MVFRVLGNALDGFLGYVPAHAFRHLPPRLISHLIDIAVRTRQIATAVYFQYKLPERDGLVSCRAYRRCIQLKQRPGSGMSRYPDRCHMNQAATSVAPSPGPFVSTLSLASGGGLPEPRRFTDPEVGRRRFIAICPHRGAAAVAGSVGQKVAKTLKTAELSRRQSRRRSAGRPGRSLSQRPPPVRKSSCGTVP